MTKPPPKTNRPTLHGPSPGERIIRNERGFDADGYRDGFDQWGYGRDGYNEYGYDQRGYNRDGVHFEDVVPLEIERLRRKSADWERRGEIEARHHAERVRNVRKAPKFSQ